MGEFTLNVQKWQWGSLGVGEQLPHFMMTISRRLSSYFVPKSSYKYLQGILVCMIDGAREPGCPLTDPGQRSN